MNPDNNVNIDVASSPQKPIYIQISTPDNKKAGLSIRQKLLVGILGIVMISLTIINIKYVSWTNPIKTQNILANLNLTYMAPKYLSEGDLNVIDVTVTNLNSSESFNGTIALIFRDPTIPIMSAPEKNLSIVIKDLNPDNKITGQFKFTVPLGSKIDTATYYFQLYKSDGKPFTSPNGTLYKSNEDEYIVAPIPYIQSVFAWRKLLGWLFVSGGLGTIISFRDEIRKFLQ